MDLTFYLIGSISFPGDFGHFVFEKYIYFLIKVLQTCKQCWLFIIFFIYNLCILHGKLAIILDLLYLDMQPVYSILTFYSWHYFLEKVCVCSLTFALIFYNLTFPLANERISHAHLLSFPLLSYQPIPKLLPAVNGLCSGQMDRLVLHGNIHPIIHAQKKRVEDVLLPWIHASEI